MINSEARQDHLIAPSGGGRFEHLIFRRIIIIRTCLIYLCLQQSNYNRRVNVKGNRTGLNPSNQKSRTLLHNTTHVNVSLFVASSILSFLFSNDSPANCASSVTVTLYRNIIKDNTASPSVSANLPTQSDTLSCPANCLIVTHLLPRHDRGPFIMQIKHNETPKVMDVLTSAERNESTSRPISKEPRWIKLVRVFPVSC